MTLGEGWLIFVHQITNINETGSDIGFSDKQDLPPPEDNHLLNVNFATRGINDYTNFITHDCFINSYFDILSIKDYLFGRNMNIKWRYKNLERINLDNSGLSLAYVYKPKIIIEVGNVEADLEACTEVSFHNMIWSTTFMGGFGCGVEW